MIHREVDEFDIRRLEEARDLVEKVAGYYYMSTNSRDLIDRLQTITKKLESVIYDAREYQRAHDRFGNRRKADG
jgi:hypothetical protein